MKKIKINSSKKRDTIFISRRRKKVDQKNRKERIIRMTKQEIYDFIKSKNIWYEITEHKAVYYMKDIQKMDLPYKESDGKNLFLRDDQKKNYYLITLKGDKKIDLKSFSHQYHTRRLSFASENDLMTLLNLKPGSVTPFGLLNDKDLKVKFYLDEEFLKDNGIIGVHPNENSATIWLKVLDFIQIMKDHGHEVHIFREN